MENRINIYECDDFQNQIDCAYDYLEKAQMANTPTSAVKYAKKALEIDPNMLDAKLIIIENQSKDIETHQSEIEKLLKLEKKNLSKMGITEKNSAGDYYLIIETRPYIRAYKKYIDLLILQGKYRKAIEACCKVCALNESDNLGIRYILIGLYALLEEEELAKELYDKYCENTSFMLLPLIVLYYKLDKIEDALKYVKDLQENNKQIKKALKLLKANNVDDFIDIITLPYYTPYSMEEMIIAIYECSFLYDTVDNFFDWLNKNLPKKK